ncbi:MAG: hypothetical protein JXP34_26800 [Planctomycetes bacterium]|nr:hypothetical protein [Planctomycetota bacterium]
MELPDLVGAVRETVAKTISRRPIHVNHASSLGGDCERQLVYMRTSWQLSQLHDVDSEMVFREGRFQEDAVLRDLMDARISIQEQQTTLTDPVFKDLKITGHVDGILIVDGVGVPLEIKSMAPHIWQAIACKGPGVYPWEEVREAFAKKPWLRKYLAQVTVYMTAKEAPWAILLCKNKSNGALAQVNVPYDDDYSWWLRARAERINAHVAAATYPDRIPWDPDICGKCSYLHLCCPDRVGRDPMAFLEEDEIKALLAARAEAAKARQAYERAHKRLQAWAKANGWKQAAIGTEWIVEKVPHGKGTKLRITRLGKEETDGEDEEEV